VEEALADIRQGKLIIVVDDEDRENEGDFVMAAEKVTPEAVNFMARYSRGLICLPMAGDLLDRLDLPPMTAQPQDTMETAFTVSIDARDTTTGISAYERCRTIEAAVAPNAAPDDLVRPGHVFPLRAKEGGVLRRPGHTEAAVDLARLAGLRPAGVICEIMNDDGTMARVPDLIEFAQQHDMKLVSIEALISYRMRSEMLVEKTAQADFPSEYGHFTLHAYEERLSNEVHVALTMGEWEPEEPVLVRVH
jgi:3,4-dihydroxy 2-butanone 4-phosphate synthase/GTP cyclohydrolase II